MLCCVSRLGLYCELSVTLVDCDHTVQQKLEIRRNRIGRYLGYLQAKANRDRGIFFMLNYIKEEHALGYEKMWSFVLQRSHVALSQHVLSFLFVCLVNLHVCDSLH